MDKTGASLPPAPPSLVPALARPVFLDATGRRRRWLRLAGLALGISALVYLLALAAVLPGPPTLPRVPLRPPATRTAPAPAGSAPSGQRLGADRA
jgi:hypothetical protein